VKRWADLRILYAWTVFKC